MFHETDSFSAVETLIKTHAPLLMRVGENLTNRRPEDGRVLGDYRRPIHSAIVRRMVRMRTQGVTIGEIARAVRVSWGTACRITKQAATTIP